MFPGDGIRPSDLQKPTYSNMCQITFNSARVIKELNANSNHILCQGENTPEESVDVWFPVHTSIILSLVVIHILAHLHLEHNHIPSKTTRHELIPYLPSSPRKVISSHTGSRFKSAAISAPLCQVPLTSQ